MGQGVCDGKSECLLPVTLGGYAAAGGGAHWRIAPVRRDHKFGLHAGAVTEANPCGLESA